MPHIHTKSNQHDYTVSAYVLRTIDSEWKCLVHLHRKTDILMQVGGHVELDQTPWQAMTAELHEEAGYDLADLDVLQPSSRPMHLANAVLHPVTFQVSTQLAGKPHELHYHSDLAYGFVAHGEPKERPESGESLDLRWYGLEEIHQALSEGTLVQDCGETYKALLQAVESWVPVPANSFSLAKPRKGIEYKR